jgi:hypothetical protein
MAADEAINCRFGAPKQLSPVGQFATQRKIVKDWGWLKMTDVIGGARARRSGEDAETWAHLQRKDCASSHANSIKIRIDGSQNPTRCVPTCSQSSWNILGSTVPFCARCEVLNYWTFVFSLMVLQSGSMHMGLSPTSLGLKGRPGKKMFMLDCPSIGNCSGKLFR